ncbi:MAG: flagellar motor switch protein FliN [Rhodoferax sp.]|nr:flagellar motor switch protein FliN [Rhodoferax sp.]
MAVEENPAPAAAAEGATDWAEALLEQKSAADAAGEPQAGSVLSGDAPRPFSSTGGSGDAPARDINMVLDIPVQLSVELGRTKVSIKHILQLGQGSVVELDALAGEPMDVLVNGYLIAQGEVVVVNDKFGIRLTDVVTPSERLRRINKG